MFLIVVISFGMVLAGGCGRAPKVATEEESQQSMDATLSFDPMSETQSEAASADPSP